MQDHVLTAVKILGNAEVGGDKPFSYWYELGAKLGNFDAQVCYVSFGSLSPDSIFPRHRVAADGGYESTNYGLGNNYLNGTEGWAA